MPVLNINTLAFLVPLLAIATAHHKTAVHSVHHVQLLSWAAVVFGFYIYRSHKALLPGLAITWALISAVWLGFDKFSIFAHSPALSFLALQLSGSQAAALIILTAFCATGVPSEKFSAVRAAFAWLAIFNAIAVLGTLIFARIDAATLWGFFAEPGINAAVIAASWPLVDEIAGNLKRRVAAFFLIAAAVAASGASVPCGVLAVALLCRFWLDRKHWLLPIMGFCGVCLILLTAIPTPFDSSTRFEMYQIFMRFWADQGRWFLGFGQGSFEVIGPAIMQDFGNPKIVKKVVDGQTIEYLRLVTHLHSDWLQLIFEQGIIGFGLVAGTCVLAFSRAVINQCHPTAASFLAFCSIGVFDYPMRLAIPAALGAVLISQCLRSEGSKDEYSDRPIGI